MPPLNPSTFDRLLTYHPRIYQLEKSVHQQGTGDAESRPLIQSEDPETILARALDVELEKISSFYNVKERELFDEVDELIGDIGAQENELEFDRQASAPPGSRGGDRARPTRLRADSAPSAPSDEEASEESEDEGGETTGLTSGRRRLSLPDKRRSVLAPTEMTASTEFTRSVHRNSVAFDDYAEQAALYSSGIMLKKRIIGLYVSLCELKSYIQLNKTGFRKVLKKFDKIMDRQLRPKYMDSFVEPAYPFRPETLKELEASITEMEKAYTQVVTNGDEEAARRDLRSHLREHVVWERNTVWRDMIGMERRAEAASLGRTLLGREADPTILQGDDERLPISKEISTPLGRFTCPTWLLGSTMLTLIAIIAIFLALLLIPIMAKPEQQNCLALLVFVSLLWATEVSLVVSQHTPCPHVPRANSCSAGHPAVCDFDGNTLPVRCASGSA